MKKELWILLFISFICAGCNSIRIQHITSTSDPEAPHALLIVAKEPILGPVLPKLVSSRSAVPKVISINEEIPEPHSFWGNATFHYRIPAGEVRVKAYFQRRNGGGGALGGFIHGLLDAKDREKAPMYVFYAETGIVYRAVANPHKQTVLIIDEQSGGIVAPAFEDVLPLLKSGDYVDTRNASKTVYLEAMQASKELAGAYADIINAYLSKPDEDELAVDAMAWASKAIGSAKITDNIDEIEKLIAADINAKIIEHAKKALEAIKN